MPTIPQAVSILFTLNNTTSAQNNAWDSVGANKHLAHSSRGQSRLPSSMATKWEVAHDHHPISPLIALSDITLAISLFPVCLSLLKKLKAGPSPP